MRPGKPPWVIGDIYHCGPNSEPPPVGSRVKILKRTAGVDSAWCHSYDNKIGTVTAAKDSAKRTYNNNVFVVHTDRNEGAPFVWHSEHEYQLLELPENYRNCDSPFPIANRIETHQEGSRMEFQPTAVELKDGWKALIKLSSEYFPNKVIWEGVDVHVDLKDEKNVLIRSGKDQATDEAREHILEVIEDMFNA